MESHRISSRRRSKNSNERERRCLVIERYHKLKTLIPIPSKGGDRATILQDGINYINELRRLISVLKNNNEADNINPLYVIRKIRHPFFKMTLDNSDDENMEKNLGSDVTSNKSLRKSKRTEVYVSIVEDEVTIKVVQKKKFKCLLFVSKVLDQLHLDFYRVTGGHVGEHYRFLLKTKINEGSTIHANAIANRVIEVVDKHCMALLSPKNNY